MAVTKQVCRQLVRVCFTILILNNWQINVDSSSLSEEHSDDFNQVTQSVDSSEEFPEEADLESHGDLNLVITPDPSSLNRRDEMSVASASESNEAITPFGTETMMLKPMPKMHRKRPVTEKESPQSSTVVTQDKERETPVTNFPPTSMETEGTIRDGVEEEDPALLSKIVENIEYVCPTGRVCRQKSIKDPKAGYRNCCEECSCDTDCNIGDQTCCFKNNAANYSTGYNGEECNFLTTSSIEYSQRHNFLSYKMEAKCPKGARKDIMVDNECDEENVAPWGSYYPVYSMSAGKIFKNKACAFCNGVTDGIVWDVMMVCNVYMDSFEGFKPLTHSIGNYESFLNGFDPDNLCYVNFKPPVPYSTLNHLKCLQEPISICPDEDFSLPEDLTMSKEQVVQACSSSFASYYSMFGAFKNVFCHICNNQLWIKVQSCMSLQTFPRVDTNAKFTTLLRKSFLEQKSNDRSIHNDLPLACMTTKDFKQECRQIYCPDGQTYDSQGNCIFPASRWDIDSYQLLLRLVPESNIQTSYINDNMIFEGIKYYSFDISKLITPFPNIWSLQTLSYRSQTDDFSSVDHFIATVRTSSLPKDPYLVHNAVKRFMKRKWFLLINDSHVGLDVEFSGMRDFKIHAGTLTPKFFNPTLNSTEQWNRIGLGWKVLRDYFALGAKESLLTLTRMFFCSQIALYKDEYVLEQNNQVLRYKNKYFLDGEFSFVIDRYTETYIPRVCIKMTGFTKQNLNGINPQKAHTSLILLLATMIIHAMLVYF